MNILTFDIEEWFHILDDPAVPKKSEWKQQQTRIEENIENVINFCKKSNSKATFFCLGWVAKNYPSIVKTIHDNGFEIGSHSTMHELVYEQTPKQFEYDLKASINLIEDITGKKVIYYRAPGFSITHSSKWAFEILVDNGIEIDCSVFPAARAHGGVNLGVKKNKPFKIKTKKGILKELPITTANFLGKELVFAGGGYFRFFPYQFIKTLSKRTDYLMTYFHPRDFDEDQPILNLSKFKKFKSYYGIKNSSQKFSQYLRDFEFSDICDANLSIDWDKAEIIEI